MVIDFHTHMFPDKIARRTLEKLEKDCHTIPCTDGTYLGLKEAAARDGVDLSIVLPPVTNPLKTASINRFASQYTEGSVISFGGIHPANENYKELLQDVKAMGMKGIKIHPDYQDARFNDIRYKRIVDYACEIGLIISVHAGRDPKCPNDVHNTPQMALEVIRDVKPVNMVLAHMGGNCMFDEAEEYVVGQDVYLDISNVSEDISMEQWIRMIKNHGIHKVLFATDSPWKSQRKTIEIVEGMPFTREEKDLIFSGNARRLLNI